MIKPKAKRERESVCENEGEIKTKDGEFGSLHPKHLPSRLSFGFRFGSGLCVDKNDLLHSLFSFFFSLSPPLLLSLKSHSNEKQNILLSFLFSISSSWRSKIKNPLSVKSSLRTEESWYLHSQKNYFFPSLLCLFFQLFNSVFSHFLLVPRSGYSLKMRVNQMVFNVFGVFDRELVDLMKKTTGGLHG